MYKNQQKAQQKIQQFSAKDVQILSKETLYQGFFKMVKYAFKHKLFEGGWSDVVEREVFERGIKVMDMTAFTLCNENGVPIVVFDMNKSGNLLRVAKGEAIGTVVTS